MQAGKSAGASVKETAANIAASAKSGMDKTKATMQEQVEKMTSHDPLEKETATQRKEDKVIRAELNKQEVREHNAAAKEAAKTGGMGTGTGTHTHSTTGATGHSTGLHQTSALPGHGTGEPTGQVTEGLVGSHPIGRSTGTGITTAHNTLSGGGTNTGYGTGGGYG